MKTVIIGCDNAAIGLKNELIEHMLSQGICVDDVGCNTVKDDTYYPEIAKKVCEKLAAGQYQNTGILICGTGIGMAMTANKFKGIRAAVCHDIFSAERAKLSNNGNVICFGERVIGVELAKKLLDGWLNLEFVDGSSTPKVEAMINIENENMK